MIKFCSVITNEIDEKRTQLDYDEIDTAPSKALKNLINTLRLTLDDPVKLCLRRENESANEIAFAASETQQVQMLRLKLFF